MMYLQENCYKKLLNSLEKNANKLEKKLMPREPRKLNLIVSNSYFQLFCS
jgi:hypothetical protein